MRWLCLFASLLTGTGCFHASYISQAAVGQFNLMAESRPMREVLEDPTTPARTVALLREVDHIKTFAERHGLDTKGNYRTFVRLRRNQAVWFLTASKPLAFEPKVWNFPVVGGFPYLGWFRRDDAVRFRERLEREGWDVYVRPVRAYSTGGWFRDPIVSSMLSDTDDAFRSLVNVVLHELVHANVLVPDQAVFNESLASFVGDRMTDDYLAERFGPRSLELALYREEEARRREFGDRLQDAYKRLSTVYDSNVAERVKQRKKDQVIGELMNDLDFIRPPNNAFLIGFKTYNAGYQGFVDLYEGCGRNWPAFIAAIQSLDEKDFGDELVEDLEPVLGKLVRSNKCAAGVAAVDRRIRD